MCSLLEQRFQINKNSHYMQILNLHAFLNLTKDRRIALQSLNPSRYKDKAIKLTRPETIQAT